MENYNDWDLIKELQKRGWNTELLFCRDDVQTQLNNINEDREAEGKEPLVLTDDDKENILESLSYEWHCERMNEEIYGKVLDFIDE
jgi:hypothetical protein